MSITLHLADQTEQALHELAARRGQDAESFLLSLVDEALLFGDEPLLPSSSAQEQAEARAGIQRGLEDFASDRHRPAAAVFSDLKARNGLPD